MAPVRRVLFVDGQERSAAATCRALDAAGYAVGVAAASRPAPGHWSLACAKRYSVPDPRMGAAPFAEEVAAIAEEDDYFTVLTAADASLLAISRHREAFGESTDLGLPAASVLDASVSKLKLVEVAAAVGLAAPETVVCETAEDARRVAPELGFPLLLKPRSTVFEHDGKTQHKGGFMASDGGALAACLPEYGLPCLLQRCEQGPVVSFAGVFAGGSLLGGVFSRYLRVWPPDAGSVASSETVDPPPSLIAKVEAFLGEMGWQGIFELELIERGPESYGVIDFNPRIYGSLALGLRAGVSLPAIWCDWLSGVEPQTHIALAGFSYRWEDAELRSLIHNLRQGRLAAAASIARPRRRCAHAFFRWNDPGPLAARLFGMQRSYRESRRNGYRARP